LCDLKERGLPVDLDELTRFKEKAEAQNKQYQKDLMETEAGKKFKAVYEEDLNIESPKHLCDLFYEIYEEKCYKKTAKGGKSVDATCLQKLNQLSRSREVKEATDIILDYKKTISFLKKLKEYEGVTGPDSRLHPSYTVNVAETYRSSTWDPNVQNMFKRDLELVKFRKIIVPSRPENYLLEVDVDGIEFRTWGMVSGAKELAHQISEFDKFRVLNPGKPNPWDPHRRWAAKLFDKPFDLITKEERFESKNSFVFATIYGSQPKPIAANMGTEVEHIEAVWNAFWEEYWEAKEWREKILADYKKNNYVSAVTGFRRPGPLSKEQIYNTPVQGPAFHLILDSLKRINRVLDKEFKTDLDSEIHDSNIFDAWPDEIEDVIELSTNIICSKRFDWQRDMPLSVTWEIGKNFYEMSEI
jgi:DNA polymerase-1